MVQLEKSLTLVPHLQPGIVGSKIWKDPSLIDECSFEFINGRPITSGEAGAAYAHFSVYDLIVQTGWLWAFVLEDNARLKVGAEDYIKSLINSIDTDPYYSKLPVLVHLNHENAKFISNRVAFSSGMQVYEPFSLLRTAKAYLINLPAAQIALNDGLPLKDVADWPHWIHNVKFFVSVTDLVEIDRSGGSEIGFRPKGKHDLRMNSKFRKLKNGLILGGFFLGLEARSYRRNTGLNDYFAWIVMDRLFRRSGECFGKQDVENSSVLILEARLFKLIRDVIKHMQSRKGTSRSQS